MFPWFHLFSLLHFSRFVTDSHRVSAVNPKCIVLEHIEKDYAIKKHYLSIGVNRKKRLSIPRQYFQENLVVRVSHGWCLFILQRSAPLTVTSRWCHFTASSRWRWPPRPRLTRASKAGNIYAAMCQDQVASSCYLVTNLIICLAHRPFSILPYITKDQKIYLYVILVCLFFWCPKTLSSKHAILRGFTLFKVNFNWISARSFNHKTLSPFLRERM